ncbi:MAG: heme ABC transporter ATP-binding protein [Chloroflexota bacterium]
MLEAHDLSFRVGQKTLVNRISLLVEVGQIVAVVGPNGAGKSTLLKLLTGELQPDNGVVWLMGKPLDDWPIAEQAKMRAVLPQRSNLAFPFTVSEVVLMGRTPYNQGRETMEDQAIVIETLQAVGMSDFADRTYTTLSGGEQQRVQLARVLAQIWTNIGKETCYLLLDEPTASLDLAHQYQTLRLAKQVAEKGIGVLTILHDLNLAAQYADTILILSQGDQVAQGSPKEMLTVDIIAQAFDISVVVLPHPKQDCPLIVPTP